MGDPRANYLTPLVGCDKLGLMKFSGSKLRTLRSEANLTQRQLSTLSGVSRGTIKRLEAGGTGTRLDTTGRLAAALGVTPDDLMEATA